jgi:exopolyphosphatase/guanosine-5'-triphosphate,3'-diphosphate pyrophosphatase
VQRHSAYIIRNAELPGFNQEQQLLLATLVGFHRKKINQEELPLFEQFAQSDVYKLLSILRLGVLLNIKRQDNLIPAINASVNQYKLTLNFADNWLQDKNLMLADLLSESARIKELGLELDCE